MSLRKLPSQFQPGIIQALPALVSYKAFLLQHGILRGILGPREQHAIWSRHIKDSLAALSLPEVQAALVKNAGYLFDFGTGGGLPGLPLSLVLPAQRFILIDSQKKRLEFIREFLVNHAPEKGQPNQNLKLVHARLEDTDQLSDYLGSCSLGFSRAFLPPGVAVELVAPYLQTGGHYVIYAGQSHKIQSLALAKKLAGTDLTLRSAEVTLQKTIHRFLVVRNNGRPPAKWPRKLKKIKQEWDELVCQE